MPKQQNLLVNPLAQHHSWPPGGGKRAQLKAEKEKGPFQNIKPCRWLR